MTFFKTRAASSTFLYITMLITQYSYYNSTNRLKNIGSGSDYTYDANGNVTYDNLNRYRTYEYDWRNLLTKIRSIKTESGIFGPEDVTYWTIYKYDKAGNRIFKQVWKYKGPDPEPIFNGDSPYWSMTLRVADLSW